MLAILIQICRSDKIGGNLSRLKYTIYEMRDRKGGFSMVGAFYPSKYNIRLEYQQRLQGVVVNVSI
jgi:hypothetical protein